MHFWFLLLGCTDNVKPLDPDLDSDGDGYTNIEEVEAGTNPDSVYSFPLEQGNYNIGQCENGVPALGSPSVQASIEDGGIEWNHYAPGDTVADIVLKDQYGQDVSLYQFCGQHIMLVIGSFT